MQKTPKFIIIRGQSGSGKSTVAHMIQKQSARQFVVLDHDYYRVELLAKIKDWDTVRDASAEMLFQNAQTALRFGCDVILDGILTMPLYKPLLDKVIDMHPEENYIFSFDTSFEETLRRHKTRAKSEHFGEQEMHEWYKPTMPTGYDFEEKIPEDFTLEQTIVRIRKVAGV